MTFRGSLRRGVSGLGLVGALALSAPPAAAQADEAHVAELKRLQAEAKEARREAEAALERARRAEAAIDKALGLTEPKVASRPDCTKPGGKLDRIECLGPKVDVTGLAEGKETIGKIRRETRDLMVYAVTYGKEEGETENRGELEVIKYLRDGSTDRPARDVSFMQIAQPVTSRLLITKGTELFDASYTYPVSRARSLSGDGSKVKPITRGLTFKLSTAFNEDDKTPGVLLRDGSFNEDTVALTVSFGSQHYPWMPLYGEGSIEERAKKFGQSLWDKCVKAANAGEDIYGKTPKKPAGCEGDALWEWSFDPSRKDDYKANVDAYNAAFWEPDKTAIPRWGWGITGGISTRDFKYIDPTNFAAGLVPNAATPRLLTTLAVKEPDGGGLFLDQISARRWSGELGGYLFRHWKGSAGPIDGFLLRGDVNVARRWRVEEASADQEFCAIKPATTGVANCEKFNIAAPEADWAIEPSVNIRTRLKFGDSFPRAAQFVPELGFSPRFTWNTQTDAIRLDVPVYLSGNDKFTELTGGIRFTRTWNDETEANNGAVWSVFLSTPFSMNGSQQ